MDHIKIWNEKKKSCAHYVLWDGLSELLPTGASVL